MNDWDHEAKRLLHGGGRDAFAPEPDDRERVRARLAATLGAAAFRASVTLPNDGLGKRAPALTLPKWALPLGLGLVALAAAVVFWPRGEPAPRANAASSSAPAVVIVAPPPSSTERVVESAAPETTSSIEPPAPAEPPAPTTGTNPPPKEAQAARPRGKAPLVQARTDQTDDEASVVAAMDVALRAGDVATAERLITEHARRFPRGQLVEERLAADVIVSCVRATASAATKAQAFLESHPKSPHRSRILDQCAALRSKVEP